MWQFFSRALPLIASRLFWSPDPLGRLSPLTWCKVHLGSHPNLLVLHALLPSLSFYLCPSEHVFAPGSDLDETNGGNLDKCTDETNNYAVPEGSFFFQRGADVHKTISAGGLSQACCNGALCVPFIFTVLVLARAAWFVVLQMCHVGGIQADALSFADCHPPPKSCWNFPKSLWIGRPAGPKDKWGGGVARFKWSATAPTFFMFSTLCCNVNWYSTSQWQFREDTIGDAALRHA